MKRFFPVLTLLLCVMLPGVAAAQLVDDDDRIGLSLVVAPTVFISGQTSTLVACVSNLNDRTRRYIQWGDRFVVVVDSTGGAVTATGPIEVFSSTFATTDFTAAASGDEPDRNHIRRRHDAIRVWRHVLPSRFSGGEQPAGDVQYRDHPTRQAALRRGGALVRARFRRRHPFQRAGGGGAAGSARPAGRSRS